MDAVLVTPLKRNFALRPETLYTTKWITVDDACYGWLAINYSDGIVTVHDVQLMPAPVFGTTVGQSFGFIDNRGGYFKGQVLVSIPNTVPNKMVTFIQIIEIPA